MAMLEIKHLKKYFAAPKGLLHAVDDVTFSIEKNHTLGVVGESGCGKSTLGKTILRMTEPTSGEVRLNGENILEVPKKKFVPYRKEMQMIFQDPYSSLDPRVNISQAIAEPLIIHNVYGKNKEALNKRVHELMDLVGIARRFEFSYPHELDGGRRQRIGIARALALDPQFIVCDEPVSALDVSIQAQVINLLRELQRSYGLTYMFITHDLSVVKYMSDDICVMYLGQIVEKCPSNELFKNTLHPYSKALLSAILSTDIHKRTQRVNLRGELTSPINPPKHCRFAPRCVFATEECFQKEPPLQEVSQNHFVACLKVKSSEEGVQGSGNPNVTKDVTEDV